jgi:uncharacterized protein YbcV (DUF1398 family)
MNAIESIIYDAHVQKWPYPKKFEALKKAGVKRYTVRFIDGFDAVYEGTFGIWHEPTPVGYIVPVLADIFSVDLIKAAMKQNGQDKSFVNFLVNAAAAGVHHYTIDMDSRIATYFNEKEDQFFESIVPEWKE